MILGKRSLPLKGVPLFVLDLIIVLILMAPVALLATEASDVQKLVEAARKLKPEAFRSVLAAMNNPSPKNLGEALVASFDGNYYAEIVPMLLDAGAAPSYGTERNNSALNKAVNRYLEKSGRSLNIVKMLLSRGAAADVFDEYGFTPLMHSASANDFELARLLIAFNARPDVQNKNGRAALNMAASNEMRELLQQAVSARPNFWSTPGPNNKQ